MRCPGEKETIIERIREVAGDKESFRHSDCVSRWMGAHHNGDWRECLDELVQQGELTTDGEGNYSKVKEASKMFKVGDRVRNTGKSYSDYAKDGTVIEVGSISVRDARVEFDGYRTLYCLPSDIELIKEEPMTGVEPVYKIVAIRDGRYWSSFVGVPNVADYEPNFAPYSALEYKIGEVTHAKDEGGVFCYNTTEEDAIVLGKCHHNVHYKAGTPAVLEVLPIGDKVVGQDCNYPAVYVVKEVWREEPKRPEPKFKVGDEVILDTDEYTGTELPCGTRLTIKSCDEEGYCTVKENCYGYEEDWLKLAPKEEWVDVTEECEYVPRKDGDIASGGNHALIVRHKGFIIAHFFANGLSPFGAEGYRFEYKKGSSWFSILEKVTQ